MRLKYVHLIIALALSLLAAWHECLASDPVAVFIADVDSLAKTTGDGSPEAFEAYVSEHALLVGAAVGQLVEQALEAADAGQLEAAEAGFSLAGRLADISFRQAGSSVLADIVNTSSSWSKHQLAFRREARDLEQQAATARTAGDIDGAIALLGRAMKIYESIGDKRSIAILWGTLGVTYWAKGDFEAVAQQYQKALEARRAIEDRILEGRTLNGLGSVNYQLAHLDLALDYYRQAIDLRRATGDTDGLATSLTYLGNTYLAMGKTLDARTALEEALPVVKQTGNTGKQYELLTSIAGLNAEMGSMKSSNDGLAEALELAQSMNDPKREIICRNNLALNLAGAYRYGEALDQLEALRQLLSEHPDPEQSMIFHRNRGITYLRIGELDMARADFSTLLDLSEQHQVPVLQLEALLNLGYLSEQAGELEDGLSYAERALSMAQQQANPKVAREAIFLAGQLERSLGRYESSAARWNAALALDERDSREIDMARDRVGLASVYVLAGRCEEARDILRGTQAVVERSQDGDLMVASAFAMGHSFERSNAESARFFYERGLDLIDQARAQVGGAGVRTGYLGGLRRFYFEEVATYYAGLAHEAGPPHEAAAAEWSSMAFRTMERAKARGLLDVLGAPVIASGSAAEEALLDSLYRLDPISPDYDDRRSELEDLYARARQERLASFNAGSSETTIAGPDEIRKVLPGGTALLEYALGDTVSLVWVIDREGSQVYFLPKRAALERAVAHLRDAIAHPMLADNVLRQTAREIYTTMVAPVEGRLKKARNLVIVPDGGLFELPFEVLLSEDPAPGLTWSDLPYLARKYSITYAPSASIYLALRLRPAPGARIRKPIMDLVAMGDPDYSLLGTTGGRQGPPLPLPHTRTEVSNIAGIMKDKNLDTYVGQEANEAALKATLRDQPSRIVHLATHGIIDRVEPTASSIVLCPDSSRTEDGYLRTLEVMSSPMDVGLVVLSACESARGEIGRGEGVVGLGRAFLAAGARSVVASLWPVADESTAILMQTFYERMLTKKQSVGRALNQARLSLMTDQRYAHPYYWSPFVVLGCEYSPW